MRKKKDNKNKNKETKLLNKKSKRKNEKKEFYFSSDNFKSNPTILIFFCDLINDSYIYSKTDNTFCVFNSINDILYLIYSKEKTSIISYNLVELKVINEIKNAHDENILNFRYYLDKINNRDLIISLSSNDNNIKLWNINICECLFNIYAYKNGKIYSACLLNNHNEYYIIASSLKFSIKIFNFNNEEIINSKNIMDSQDCSYFIDTFYDNKLDKNYIISGNKGSIKSYDFDNNILYRVYESGDESINQSIIIIDNENIIKLISSGRFSDANIKIFNYHKGDLLKNIKLLQNNNLLSNWTYSICLWNKDYLLLSDTNRTIKLIELKTGKSIKELKGQNKEISTIKKIKHPQYGECLISQDSNQIKLWITNQIV